MARLANKVALVTGSSKGIGAGIAKALAAEGAAVIVNYATSKAGADAVVAEIAAAGGKATAVQGDFSKEADIVRVFADVAKTQKKIDILVNNAGVYAFQPIEQVTPEEFQRQFGLNVLGLLLSIKSALPLFGPDGGSIINIGSAAGKMSPAYSAVYSGTKGAVDSITLALSKELGARKIRVNALNPGFVETEGTVSAGFHEGEMHDFFVKTTPLGRGGRPDDISKVAVFLASDEAGWVNGQLIGVNGGQTM